jgi:hypothetical protein
LNHERRVEERKWRRRKEGEEEEGKGEWTPSEICILE